jgi:hypothetical protein
MEGQQAPPSAMLTARNREELIEALTGAIEVADTPLVSLGWDSEQCGNWVLNDRRKLINAVTTLQNKRKTLRGCSLVGLKADDFKEGEKARLLAHAGARRFASSPLQTWPVRIASGHQPTPLRLPAPLKRTSVSQTAMLALLLVRRGRSRPKTHSGSSSTRTAVQAGASSGAGSAGRAMWGY